MSRQGSKHREMSAAVTIAVECHAGSARWEVRAGPTNSVVEFGLPTTWEGLSPFRVAEFESIRKVFDYLADAVFFAVTGDPQYREHYALVVWNGHLLTVTAIKYWC